MYRNMMRDFEDDPFFREHNRRIASMMNGFGDPFSRPFGFPALAEPTDHYGSHRTEQRQIAPTDMFSSMFANMNSMMVNMQRNFHQMANDPNTYSYSSSSVMSYSSDGRGEPKYFQASKSTKKAPGGVRETQHAYRDSESGVQRMAIGHHLDDRSHVIERSLNRRTGEEERKQDFINLDEADAHSFDQEWKQRTKQPLNVLKDNRRERHRALEVTDPTRHKQHSRHAGLEAPPRRDHTHAVRGEGRGSLNHRDFDIREPDASYQASRYSDWGRDDSKGQATKTKASNNREKKVRVNSRPVNRHEPRGGL